MSVLLLSVCVDELLSAPKIITVLPKSKLEISKGDHENNLMAYPEQDHLSRLASWVSLLTRGNRYFNGKITV